MDAAIARPETYPCDPCVPAAMTLVGVIALPGTERSVAAGRGFVRDALGSHHPALDVVGLSVSELATNAIRHTPSGAGGRFTIRLATADRRIRAEVVNDGVIDGEPHRRSEPGIDAEHGRGLLLIDALADRWGVTRCAGTTTVWAEFGY
ncbi:ATP-binding protein [Actinoallomurus sp. CA-150999]|uniref:ATP-binding protein n=1 Tax=Actinoallomurus sp. CA-150999 TaxID=3239887 RepID=UPI003D91AED8